MGQEISMVEKYDRNTNKIDRVSVTRNVITGATIYTSNHRTAYWYEKRRYK
jgi:hypothetical protein